VTVVLTKPAASLKSHLESIDSRIEVSFATLPESIGGDPVPDPWTPRIAEARRAYVEADWERCQERLAEDPSLVDTLTTSSREQGQRILFWRIACAVGAGNKSQAKRLAAAFAAFEFDPPPDVDSASPDIEVLINRVAKSASSQARVALSIRADVIGASVWVDGRADVCSTPCTTEVLRGDHVVALRADGFKPEGRLVHAAGPSVDVELPTTPAPPELASRQWTARYSGTPRLTDAAAMKLLQLAIPSKRLVLVERELTDLRGVLVAKGVVEARAERMTTGTKALSEPARSLMRELLVDSGALPKPAPLWKRTSFWVGVAAAAVVGAGLTTALLYDPPVTTSVVLR